ncbi:hypothetical protein VDF31_07720, partial [Xanthomonas campestris pv. raphani]|uniref:hypothetical protein n=1 Tax=Xanthomonas campestris TaxID=339 RepID=UPI002B234524
CQIGLCGWGNGEMQYYTSRPENARIMPPRCRYVRKTCSATSTDTSWYTRARTAAGHAVAAFDCSAQKGFGPLFRTTYLT